ncbi:NAD dependent epimerase/dehydratase family protein-like protein [Aureobasidium sp. EXF-8846]|nr:NAD dependent epimerase/dehydratase family protein-like protein [Aureobasidium sp. EXF-8846]
MADLTCTLAGSTGLVGANIYSVLSSHPAVSSLYAYARKDLPATSAKSHSLVSTDTSTWASLYPKASSIFFSALGTTRGAAGSVENQRKIDYDLNLDLAKAAKEHGATTCVIVSSGGANPTSMLAYPRMKGELEEAVKQLDFEHTIILRPGLIVGQRQDSRPPEFAFRKIAQWAGKISEPYLKDFWAQDADVIAKAAVSAALQCHEGKVQHKVWMLGQADIIRLGKTEWNRT